MITYLQRSMQHGMLVPHPPHILLGDPLRLEALPDLRLELRHLYLVVMVLLLQHHPG